LMWQTIGHTRITDLLERALSQDHAAHAYLLSGPPRIGKMTLSLDIACALNCSKKTSGRPCGECASCKKILNGKHADVEIIDMNYAAEEQEDKEKTRIGVEHVNDILHSASLPPFEGKCRVFIIDEASNLSTHAANRLLKILEEPPANVVFILLTANSQLIPATIKSRCQRLDMTRVNIEEIENTLINKFDIDKDRASLLSRLSRGGIGWAIEAAQDPKLMQEREENFEKMKSVNGGDYNYRFAVAGQIAQQFSKKRGKVYEALDEWARWWRDVLLVKTGCDSDITGIDHMADIQQMGSDYTLNQIIESIRSILDAIKQLRLNVNSRLVLEVLMLNLPRVKLNNTSCKTEVKNA
jgi:DNA polymerase III subunit delta'